jgi:hypothetical protein
MEKHIGHKPPDLQTSHGVIGYLAEVEKEFSLPAQRQQKGKLRNEDSDVEEKYPSNGWRQMPPEKTPDVRKSIPGHSSTRYVAFQLLKIYLLQKREINKKRQQLDSRGNLTLTAQVESRNVKNLEIGLPIIF